MTTRKTKRLPAHTRESPKARKIAFEFVEGTLKRSIRIVTAACRLVEMADSKDDQTLSTYDILPIVRAALNEQITELKFALTHSYRATGRERPAVQS